MNHHAHPLEEPAPPTVGGQSARDYVGWFLRRFWIFLLTVVGGYFLGSYIYSLTPPTYQSYATIEILRVKKEAADVTEEEKIRMNGIAEMFSAAEKLQMPSLYEGVAKGHLFSNRDNLVPKQFHFPWDESPSPTREQISDEWLGGMMRGWVSVRWREDTNLIDIYASHSDASVARDTLVGLLAEYERSTDTKLAGSSDYALDYILESSTAIKEKLLRLERALQLYASCQNLSEQIRESERRIDEMEKRYLEKWPALVEAKQHREILRDRFSAELEQVLRLSSEEMEFWKEKQEVLTGVSDEDRVNTQIQLVTTRSSVLDRELDAEQQIYDNLITKLKEGNVSKGFASKHFDIVQPPNLSSSPTGPSKKKIVSKYLMGGAALGIGLILLLGFLDQKIRTPSELEMITDCTIIGTLPTLKDKRPDNHLALDQEENSRQSEAVRNLRAGLSFLGGMDERRSFLITSSIATEGKSYVAANLALSFAKQGERTLLIDADLRLPTQHTKFGYEERRPGLADHLALRKPLKELVLRSDVSKKLYLLPAGSRSANPSELLAGKNLPILLKNLAKYFDRIVIDSAPLVPVSDTIPLAQQADSVVLVSRIGVTPRGAIRRALRLLSANQANLVGVVANGIASPRLMFGYSYGYPYGFGSDYGYEYGDSKEKA